MTINISTIEAEFKKELRKQYKDILPEEMLEKSEHWFIPFIRQSCEKLLKEMVGEELTNTSTEIPVCDNESCSAVNSYNQAIQSQKDKYKELIK